MGSLTGLFEELSWMKHKKINNSLYSVQEVKSINSLYSVQEVKFTADVLCQRSKIHYSCILCKKQNPQLLYSVQEAKH